jgi:hypothetical protein
VIKHSATDSVVLGTYTMGSVFTYTRSGNRVTLTSAPGEQVHETFVMTVGDGTISHVTTAVPPHTFLFVRP